MADWLAMTTAGPGSPIDNRPQNPNEAEILLVEDNPGDVRLIKEAFNRGSVSNRLYLATDGREALDFIYQRDKFTDSPRPDIVLLDFDLPKVNGDEVLSEINSSLELQCIPVVVLAGSEAQEDIIKSQVDADGYLTKPVEIEEFIDLVRTFDHFWLSLVRLSDDEQP